MADNILTKPLIALGADHAGFAYKEEIKKLLIELDFQVLDMGTFSADSVDYPDFVHPVAKAVTKGEADKGILICGSGQGVCMTANKYQDIRAALVWTDEIAKFSRSHNDANILCLAERFTELEIVLKIVQTFLTTEFEGGRHARRVDKISCQID